jgi:hypothetical protein
MPRRAAWNTIRIKQKTSAIRTSGIEEVLQMFLVLWKASPLGSNGDDRRQWRKQGGAVGAAASRMRAAAKQTLGAATRAVALRSNDGEGKPGTKEPLHSDKQALCQSDTIAV